jgi:hypothetical protein
VGSFARAQVYGFGFGQDRVVGDDD